MSTADGLCPSCPTAVDELYYTTCPKCGVVDTRTVAWMVIRLNELWYDQMGEDETEKRAILRHYHELLSKLDGIQLYLYHDESIEDYRIATINGLFAANPAFFEVQGLSKEEAENMLKRDPPSVNKHGQISPIVSLIDDMCFADSICENLGYDLKSIDNLVLNRLIDLLVEMAIENPQKNMGKLWCFTKKLKEGR